MNPLPDVGAYLKITAGEESWTHLTSAEECLELKTVIENAKKAASLIERLVYPIRTDTLENFAEDFFLPTIVNQELAGRVRNIFLKVLLLIPSLFLDLISFPVRCFTAIPRMIYNAQKKSGFHEYLEKKKAPKQICESKSPNLKFVAVRGCAYKTQKGSKLDYEFDSSEQGAVTIKGSSLDRFSDYLKTYLSEEEVRNPTIVAHLTPKLRKV